MALILHTLSNGSLLDRSGYGYDGAFTAGNSKGFVRTDIGMALGFDGSISKVVISKTVPSIKTVAFIIKLLDSSKDIIDFDGGAHSIEVASGTLSATGFISPTIYVDNALTTTISSFAWKHMLVSTSTSFNGTAIELGTETTFLHGQLLNVKMWDTVLTQKERDKEFEEFQRIKQLGQSAPSIRNFPNVDSNYISETGLTAAYNMRII